MIQYYEIMSSEFTSLKQMGYGLCAIQRSHKLRKYFKALDRG